MRTEHRAEVAAHSLTAYESLRAQLRAQPRPLVLDSFCGTGHSTSALAEQHPGHLIVGIDKSALRLAKLLGVTVGDVLALLFGGGER